MLAYIPQNHAPVFDYSVLDMVLMGTNRTIPLFGGPGNREKQLARWALARVGAQMLEDRNYRHLSGGQQQLVLIARALAQRSRILLMDEPTANLDYGNQLRVLDCVCSLADRGYTVLLSSHNPQHALWYGDRVLALDAGNIVAYGPPESVLNAKLLQRLYGVDAELIGDEKSRVILPLHIKEMEAMK